MELETDTKKKCYQEQVETDSTLTSRNTIQNRTTVHLERIKSVEVMF